MRSFERLMMDGNRRLKHAERLTEVNTFEKSRISLVVL